MPGKAQRSVALGVLVLALVVPAADVLAQPYFRRTQVITAPEPNIDFVNDVAVDGEWAAAAAPRDFATSGVSAVFMYRRVSGIWTLQQRIVCPATTTICDTFGERVALSGTTLAAGAGSGSTTGTRPNGVFVFALTGSTWTLQTTLTAPAGLELDSYSALALSGDRLVVSATPFNAGANNRTAFVFERNGSTWTRLPLNGTDRVPADGFASSAGISGDTICLGASGFYTDAQIPGAVHMFRRTGAGWVQEGPKLTPLAVNGARVGLSCSVDGDTVAFGAGVFTPGQPGSGRVFVYTRSGSTWSALQTLLPDDGNTGDLGTDVAVRGDGMVVGADGNTAPRALFYARVNGLWQLRLRDDSPIANASFGEKVATDGVTLMVGGAPFASRPGVLAVYEPSTTAPAGPPGSPQNFVASASGNVVSLSWQPPATGAAATSYTLIVRTAVGGPVVTAIPLGNVTTFTASAPNGVFVLSVSATNAQGTGPESATTTLTVPSVAVPPGPPANLVASVTGSTITFNWSAPSSGGAPTGYVLLAGLTPSFTTSIASLPLAPSPRSDAVPGVPPGTYYVRLVAQNSGGMSAASNEIAVTVAGATVPSAPTLPAPIVSGSTVQLSWAPGSGGAPASYTLFAATTPGGAPIATLPLTGTGITIPNVPSGTYYLRLTATNAAGTSLPSAERTLVVP